MNLGQLIDQLEDEARMAPDGMESIIEVVTDEDERFNVVSQEDLDRGRFNGQATVRVV